MTMRGGLWVAVELAQRQRDEAGQALAQVLRRHDNARLQMEQLESYAADTQARWSVGGQTQTSPQIVGHYYQFMARLEQTITLQQGVIDDVQGHCQAARQSLRDAELHMAGLSRLLEKRQRELARAAARQEQRQSDEFAARARPAASGLYAYRDKP